MLTKVREQCMNKVRLSTKRKNKKVQSKTHRDEEYNNWAEKFSGEVQQQTRLSETKLEFSEQ